LSAFLDMVMKLKPASSKGIYMKSIAISSTMGPGVRADATQVKDYLKS